MPVPNYLKDIACSERKKKDFTEFDLKCKCGNVLFDLYENFLTKEERKLCKPYYDALDRTINHCAYIENEDGTYSWEIIRPAEENVIVPPKPACASVYVIRAKCSECGNEYVIFDNRCHGYDGKFANEADEEVLNYIPYFKKKRRRDNLPVQVIVGVEHDPDIEDFKKATGIDCSFEDCTEAFTWIRLYTIDSSGKKRKILDLETA